MKKDLHEKILNHLEEVKKILEVEEMKLEGKGDRNGDIFYIQDNKYRKPLKDLDFNKVLELILSGENYAL